MDRHNRERVNAAQELLLQLQSGEHLRVAIELNNPVTVLVVQLETPDDYHMIVWTPRYFVKDLFLAICESPNDIRATVVKVNPPPAPSKQRVLIEIKGRWDVNYEPMSAPEYQSLLKIAA